MRFPPWLQVFGDTEHRDKNCPKEQLEQITFIARLRKQYPKTLGALAVHVKNEGKRTHGQVMFAKAEGLTKGAPDIIIPTSPPMLIEIKRRDHTASRWQAGQLDYLEAAHKLGAFACVALGADAAMEAVQQWLEKYGQ